MNKPFELYVFRHGKSQANSEEVYCGISESPLLPQSIEESSRLGEFFKSIRFDRIYRSPLGRNRQTLEALGLKSREPVVIDPRLIEMNYGTYELTPEAKIPRELFEKRKIERENFCWPRGESYSGQYARVKSFVLAELAKGGVIAVIGHKGTNRFLRMILEGLSFKTVFDKNLIQANTSVWRFQGTFGQPISFEELQPLKMEKVR